MKLSPVLLLAALGVAIVLPARAEIEPDSPGAIERAERERRELEWQRMRDDPFYRPPLREFRNGDWVEVPRRWEDRPYDLRCRGLDERECREREWRERHGRPFERGWPRD